MTVTKKLELLIARTFAGSRSTERDIRVVCAIAGMGYCMRVLVENKEERAGLEFDQAMDVLLELPNPDESMRRLREEYSQLKDEIEEIGKA